MRGDASRLPRVQAVREAASGPPGRPVLRLDTWERCLPGVVAGLTGVVSGGEAGSESDFGLATGGESGRVMRRYEALSRDLGFSSVAIGRQVHGSRVVTLRGSPERGVHVQGEADGITTDEVGVLLAVTVADCVPVYLSGPLGRAIGLVHAGWRGAAAGVLEVAIGVMERRHGVAASRLRVHLGPAICGSCYEVGPEVFAALGMGDCQPGGLDLRGVLAERARRSGVAGDRLTISSHCTLCGPTGLFSHRGQGRRAGRMAGFLGRIAVPTVDSTP